MSPQICDHRAGLGLVSIKFREQGTSDHTLMGASSSSRIGWPMKISRAFVQRNLISVSSSWTCFPGRLPRTSSRRSMMESRSTSCWSAIASTYLPAIGRQEGRWVRIEKSKGWRARKTGRVSATQLSARCDTRLQLRDHDLLATRKTISLFPKPVTSAS